MGNMRKHDLPFAGGQKKVAGLVTSAAELNCSHQKKEMEAQWILKK